MKYSDDIIVKRTDGTKPDGTIFEDMNSSLDEVISITSVICTEIMMGKTKTATEALKLIMDTDSNVQALYKKHGVGRGHFLMGVIFCLAIRQTEELRSKINKVKKIVEELEDDPSTEMYGSVYIPPKKKLES